ncbi:probable RNA-binding protein 18 [Lineus longissimus]|uniref:probable RNA-binding protein 18 n=1 Tax=Lineus longissimus TaxID=88925 RepID=UPI002B4FA1E4
MDKDQDVPLPLPIDDEDHDDRRLWVGNLDSRITEFALLKIFQKYGKLEKFDFLYNKTGPDIGKPRGYCFITYEKKEQSQEAMKRLNGKLALSKRLQVRWAHASILEPPPKSKVHILGSNLGSTSKDEAGSSQSKISAIEAKLRLMEKTQNDFTISTKPVGSLTKQQPTKPPTQTVKHGFKPYSKSATRR